MSTLTLGKKRMMGRKVEAPSEYPGIVLPIKFGVTSALGEDEGLFLNFGMKDDSLPYTMCDNYDGDLQELTFDSAVLENEYLRAEIVISLGGRLWSLYDKVAQRDLLLDNHQFLPGNLAIRNAWFAGGVEWNIGRRGHDAQTTDPRFAATLKDEDGTPVLRIYEISRDALTPFQLDFFLPDGSRFLFVRNRISNPNRTMVPMYWWSNIAVAQEEGARVVVPTFETYTNEYLNGAHAVGKTHLPDGEGFDGTYPTHFKRAEDYFFKIPEESRKYECVIFKDGYGLAHCSTRRLKGRKLFVWGMTPGGNHWQRRLMAPDTPDYIEIQGGLAATQQECIPMPPNTAWEWLEAYGPITVAPEKCFGDWKTAVETVSARVDEILPEKQLDDLLKRTHDTIALKKGETVAKGSGWGALECLLRGGNIAPQLDYGPMTAEQNEWKMLLEEGRMDDSSPRSYMVQDEWFDLLKKAQNPNWKILYHLALNYYRRQDMERAEQCILRSLDLQKNTWNLQLLAYFRRFAGRFSEATTLFEELLKLRNDNVSLAKDSLKTLLLMKQYEAILEIVKCLSPDVQRRPLIQFIEANALAHTGELEEAEKMIMANGGLEVFDIREGEISTSDLYIYIQVEKARRAGQVLKPEQVHVPFALDLRMS